MISIVRRLMVALSIYSVMIFLRVVFEMMAGFTAPVMLNYFVVACFSFSSWEIASPLYPKHPSLKNVDGQSSIV